jgi:energy-coupling factor transport system ATP-binding protein
VEKGETVLLLGPSGSGKSTLALCLNGLIPHLIEGHFKGHVLIEGRDTADTPVRELAQAVGVVFQDPEAQFCTTTVEDEVAFGLENLNVPPGEMYPRIVEGLRTVHLLEERAKRVDRLSGGNKQRLALAAILAMQPRILVFDEPTANLDPVGTQLVFSTIEELRSEGKHTIIIIEHKLDHLMHIVDRVIALGPEGRLLAQGRPAEVFGKDYEMLRAHGVWQPQVCELAHALAREGLRLRPFPVTMEDAVKGLRGLLDGRDSSGWESARDNHPLAAESEKRHGSAEARREGWRRHGHALDGGASTGERETAPFQEDPYVCPPQVSHFPTPPSLQDDVCARPPAIEVRNLRFAYGRKVVLDGLNLTVANGDFLAVVGANGAGKTTLAKYIGGVIRAPRGAVMIEGKDVNEIPERVLSSTVGFVFQNPEHQFVEASVFDELAFGLRTRGVPESEVARKVEAALETFGLTRYARANPFALSHGEKRRLSVAAMLIAGQRILVLDEPTYGQDRENAASLLAWLQEISQQGKTILIITHDMNVVAEYAKGVAVLDRGKIVYNDGPRGLFARADLLERSHLSAPVLYELGQAVVGRYGQSQVRRVGDDASRSPSTNRAGGPHPSPLSEGEGAGGRECAPVSIADYVEWIRRKVAAGGDVAGVGQIERHNTRAFEPSGKEPR